MITDLKWWLSTLLVRGTTCTLVPQIETYEIASDTGIGIGIGISIGTEG